MPFKISFSLKPQLSLNLSSLYRLIRPVCCFADDGTLLLNNLLFVYSFSCCCCFSSPPSSPSFSLMEAKRSQSISNCAHLYEALPATKSVPMLLHTVSSFLPGISSGSSACSHRLSGKVHSESCMYLCQPPPPAFHWSFH